MPVNHLCATHAAQGSVFIHFCKPLTLLVDRFPRAAIAEFSNCIFTNAQGIAVHFEPEGREGGHKREGLIMSRYLTKFWKDQSGATAIEYGLIAAGISVAIIAAVQATGTGLKTTFTSVSTALK